jgi:hypothetical protein
VHRLAWTVADLKHLDRPGTEELDVAIRLRTGEPLLLAMTGSAAAATAAAPAAGTVDNPPRTWPAGLRTGSR